MTILSIFDAHNPDAAKTVTDDSAEIGQLLESKGIRFERWSTQDLPADAAPEQILEAYSSEIAS